ncbi:hypothetical protein [Legionella micdadei]|nr:hypothetical protein [Legionella micdadei]ARG97002.1 hypothetical protein B6N58_04580 [Legionella micdadei]ARH00743.1 hypothetical protein B6V88_10120 [Legionella micdadei]NSL18221.1 hypothetical protein [Legionella micdadei]
MKDKRLAGTSYVENSFLWDENIRIFFSYYFFKIQINEQYYFMLETTTAESIQRLLNNKTHELGVSFHWAYFQHLSPKDAEKYGLGNKNIIYITEKEGRFLNDFETTDISVKYSPQQIILATRKLCQLIGLDEYAELLIFSHINQIVSGYRTLRNPDTVLGLALANAAKQENLLLISPLIRAFLKNPRCTKIFEAYTQQFSQSQARPLSSCFFDPGSQPRTYTASPKQRHVSPASITGVVPPCPSLGMKPQGLIPPSQPAKTCENHSTFFNRDEAIRRRAFCVSNTLDLTPRPDTTPTRLPSVPAYSIAQPSSTAYLATPPAPLRDFSSFPNDDFTLDASELDSLFEEIDSFLEVQSFPKLI